MLGDFSMHSSADPPLRVAPEEGVQQAADELQPQPQRTPDLRPDQLAALVEIHRAVAGHLDRKALFTAIADVLQKVVPVSRVNLLLPCTDPSALTVYATYGKLGLEFYEGQTIPRAGAIAGWVVEHGRPIVVNSAEDVRERFPISHQRAQRWGME